MLSDKFICATYDYTTYRHAVPSPYFRKVFELNESLSKAAVTITGLGFYDIFINGEKITKGLLAPYISNPDHIVYYDEYDIMSKLKNGKNVLGIQLGNGMQNCPGGQVWDFDKASFRGSPRTAFAIELTDSDGKATIIEADETVKTAPSGLLFDDLRCGVVFDSEKEPYGWAGDDFDDSGWSAALIAEKPRGEKTICRAEPVLPFEERAATEIRPCTLCRYHKSIKAPNKSNPFACGESDGILYDFGYNTAGIYRLKINGKPGQQIDLQFGEYLNNDSQPDISNIDFYPKGYSQRDVFICRGGEEVFEPSFTYHGYRYCVVFGLEKEQAVPDLLTMIICHSDIKSRGSFSCSDETLNKLQAMTRNSTLSNFYYFPTDCPQREKNGWTGDAAASCSQTMLNFAPEESYREWLKSIRKAQNSDGQIPGIVPTDTWGYNWGYKSGVGPCWDAVLTKLPFMIYKMSGDIEILKENAQSIFNYLSYIESRLTKRGTVNFGLGDWVPITVVKSPVELTSSLMTMSIADMASKIFAALGDRLKEQFANSLYEKIRSSVRKYLINFNTMTAAGCCQTSQSMAIYYNAFDEAEKPFAFKRLLEIIERADSHLDCGFLGVQYIFRVLADFGECDLAYTLMARRDYPSYGNFVERGLTALPEDFKRDSEKPNSLNHHFLGDISSFFYEYICGIRVNPYDRDAHEINIQPCFLSKLENAAAEYDSIDGKIKVEWLRQSKGIMLNIVVPKGIYGKIILPDGFSFEDSSLTFKKLESGEYAVQNAEC